MQLPPERIEEIRRLVVEEYAEFVDRFSSAHFTSGACDCPECLIQAGMQAGWQLAEMRIKKRRAKWGQFALMVLQLLCGSAQLFFFSVQPRWSPGLFGLFGIAMGVYHYRQFVDLDCQPELQRIAELPVGEERA